MAMALRFSLCVYVCLVKAPTEAETDVSDEVGITGWGGPTQGPIRGNFGRLTGWAGPTQDPKRGKFGRLKWVVFAIEFFLSILIPKTTLLSMSSPY